MSHATLWVQGGRPWAEEKEQQQALDLPSQASRLLHFGSSSPGKGPGRAGPSAWATASAGSAGHTDGQGGLRFPESRWWIRWHDTLPTSQIPSIGNFLQALSELVWGSEWRKGKETSTRMGCLPYALPSPPPTRSVPPSLFYSGGNNETPSGSSKQWR